MRMCAGVCREQVYALYAVDGYLLGSPEGECRCKVGELESNSNGDNNCVSNHNDGS